MGNTEPRQGADQFTERGVLAADRLDIAHGDLLEGKDEFDQGRILRVADATDGGCGGRGLPSAEVGGRLIAGRSAPAKEREGDNQGGVLRV